MADAVEQRAEPFDAGARGRKAAEHIVERPLDLDRTLAVAQAEQFGLGARMRQGDRQRLSGAERIEQDARPKRAERQGSDDVIVAADADGTARRQTGQGGRFSGHLTELRAVRPDRREQVGRQARLGDQVVRPHAPAQIERERARGERGIARHLAAQPPGEVVGDVQPAHRALQHLGLVRFQPEKLAEREGRIGRQAAKGVQPLETDLPGQPVELGPRPLVVPGDHRADRLAVRVDRDERLADARGRDACDAPGPLELAGRLAQGGARQPPTAPAGRAAPSPAAAARAAPCGRPAPPPRHPA